MSRQWGAAHGAGFAPLIGTGVVRSQQRKQIALGLAGDASTMSVRCRSVGELDDSLLVEISDLDAFGNVMRRSEELRHAARAVRSCSPSLPWAILKPGMVGRRWRCPRRRHHIASEPGEMARPPEFLIQSAALGIWNRAVGSPGSILILDERIEQGLFTHGLEEVLLSPALEHVVSATSMSRRSDRPVIPASDGRRRTDASLAVSRARLRGSAWAGRAKDSSPSAHRARRDGG